MNGMLAAGRTLITDEGDKVTVGKLYGYGGQGEVYQVRTPSGKRALKWYYPQWAQHEQRSILQGLIDRSWKDDRFLWPQTLVTDPKSPDSGFGYLMDVRPDRFLELPALFRRNPRRDPDIVKVNARTLVTAALHTVEAYRALHSKGIAYRDINWGNIFFDPSTGDVLVCDNDNAVFEGDPVMIGGTMDFMAPELVRGDSGAQPGIQTDLHSLAVLLFMLLMNHHPFEGALAWKIRCLDEAAKKKLYGTDPVFIYSPEDRRNRPVAGEQETVIETWGVLPPTLRNLFITTFTKGLVDSSRRVRENQWREALSQVRDAIIPCSSCGRLNLTEPEGAAPACWKCKHTLVLPKRLEVTSGTGNVRVRRSIRLGHDACVFAHHLDGDPDRHDFTNVVGEVTEHPKQRGRFGLTNRTSTTWTARRDDGSVSDVPPGRSAALRSGLLLEFGGGAEAVIHAQ